jgi:hypothetical protein
MEITKPQLFMINKGHKRQIPDFVFKETQANKPGPAQI